MVLRDPPPLSGDPKWLRIQRSRLDAADVPDFAILLVGIVSRQAASPTARVQARLAAPVSRNKLRPADGRFAGRRAAAAPLPAGPGVGRARPDVNTAFTLPFQSMFKSVA
ncbi:hypothetical protein ACPVPU_01925 [Sphingomonas sp. CJ99]